MKKGLQGVTKNTVAFLMGAAAAAVLAVSGPAVAKDYPTKPVSWIVTWPAGGGADTATRTFTKYFEKELGGTIVIKNIVGGGASIGYMTAKQSPADGYTLLTVQGDLPKFAPTKLAPIEIKDYDFIAGFAVQSPVLVVQADSPWKTIKDFVEDAKANPGKRTIGVSDVGGVHHQPVILWAKQAGIEVRAIAHDGSPQMNAAILGGHVDMISSYVRPAVPYVKEGKLRFLGYFGSTPPADYSDIPTVKDSGYDVVWEQPYGIGAPAGIPDDAKKALAAAAEKVWANPEFAKNLGNLGLDLYAKSGEELKQALQRMQEGIVEVTKILQGAK